ncbi:hypothetical protein MED121_03641 [Marinomonas sp. MED121]|uniref:hypothetical protein n=1 Tax=Marinomonas sp. MED121 TaxID=314277 RepID=UPI000068FE43|nr:hypothetical protein [Marinomonas sp. MED121]EAQ63128.1 hypothetical protein MED121_03641 [Marinomonas sp. MED121]
MCPIPEKLGLSPIGINKKNNQIFCATSAMASLGGYIKATDDQGKARAGPNNSGRKHTLMAYKSMLLHLIQQEAWQ